MLDTLKSYATKIGVSGVGFLAAATSVAAQISVEPIAPGTGFATDVGVLINAVLTFVMVIAALLVFLYLIMGGIQWITSGGDKGKTEEARNKITSAIVGLIVLAASYAILLIALRFLGFNDLTDVFSQTKNIE